MVSFSGDLSSYTGKSRHLFKWAASTLTIYKILTQIGSMDTYKLLSWISKIVCSNKGFQRKQS